MSTPSQKNVTKSSSEWEEKRRAKASAKPPAPPEFHAAGVTPLVKFAGDKALGECLCFLTLTPGSNTAESVTIHRPVGITNLPVGSWTGTRSSSLPSLMAAGANDLKLFGNLLNQCANEHLVGDKLFTVALSAIGKNVLCYSTSVVSEALKEVIKAEAESRRINKSWSEAEAPEACEIRTLGLAKVISIHQGFGHEGLIPRGEMKDAIEAIITSQYKNSDAYAKYQKALGVYTSLDKKARHGKHAPVAPAKTSKWTDFIPHALSSVEIKRSDWIRNNRAVEMERMLSADSISPTKEPYSRNEQVSIHAFFGLSLSEIKERHFGFLHFGENINAPLPMGKVEIPGAAAEGAP